LAFSLDLAFPIDNWAWEDRACLNIAPGEKYGSSLMFGISAGVTERAVLAGLKQG